MPAYAKAAAAALAARSLWATPGNTVSKLGTSKAPTLPHYLEDNPLPQGYPWGDKTVMNTNPYQVTPNTGVTRHYEFTIERQPCAPDGIENTCLLVNNEFPGPLLEANWGDYIEVKVNNMISDEGLAIHWHGLLQKATPYMDGVPGNSQCPISPNKTFTYRFQADLYGSSWYHSHWSSQYGSGLFGPIVIYGPKNVDYDVDMGPIIVSDYYDSYYTVQVEKTLAPPEDAGPPLATNNLINGKTNNGGPGIATFNVTSGKTYRMRVINTSAASVQKFSIDGYNFTVFQNDFVPIEPYETDVLTLTVGQRNDILFKATGMSTDAVWMRGYRPPPCGPSAGNEEVLAAIFYEDADRSKLPTTEAGPNAYSQYCGNDPLEETVPTYTITPPEPDITINLRLEYNSNGTALLWYMNGQTFRIDYNDPMLLEAKLGNLDFPEIRNAYIYNGSINSIRMIIENPVAQPHPMHLHGHNIWVLQEGPCTALPGPASESAAPSGFAAPTATEAQPEGPSTTNYPNGYHGGSGGHGGRPSETGSYASSTAYSAAPSSTGTSNSRRSSGGNWKNSSSVYVPPNSCWDGSIVRPENPQRRDVQMLQNENYIVIQWLQDNPGVWPLHCHIAWHLSAGFALMVVENPEAIQQEMQIPSVMAQTCRDWAAYSGDHVVHQIDDGI